MEQKTCNACGRTFAPRPQTPNQTYCNHPECQRERRRRWQQQIRQGDFRMDYRHFGREFSVDRWRATEPDI